VTAARLAVLGAAIWIATPAHGQPTSWDIKVPERIEVAVGATVPLPISISVDRGFSVSKDGPVIVDVVPDSGVTIKKRRLLRADAADPEADVPRFAIPVRGDTAGDRAVKLRIRLWLCGGKVCRPLDVKRQTVIAVAPEPPTP
jgi:hypothetical protein